MAKKYMVGKVDVSLNGITIPASLLSDEGVKTTFTEGSYEIPTMAGTITQASGIYDESTVAFIVVLPNMRYLGNILPDMFTPSVDRPTVAGRIAIGGDTCVERENTPVVVHYTCDPNSDNDVYVPNGSVQATFEMTQNATDPVTVTFTVNAQPEDETGVLAYLGTGDLTEPTLWDAVAEAYEPIGS